MENQDEVKALGPEALTGPIGRRVGELYQIFRSLGELPLCIIIFLPRVALSYFTIL